MAAMGTVSNETMMLSRYRLADYSTTVTLTLIFTKTMSVCWAMQDTRYAYVLN